MSGPTSDPEKWLKIPYSYHTVHARQVPWFPGDDYASLPPSLIHKGDLALINAHDETLDGFMASLPHWDFDPPSGNPNPLPWRVIWTWRPIFEAHGGKNANANSGYVPDPWYYPQDLYDAGERDIFASLPDEVANYHDRIVVHPLYRIIVFHQNAKPRHKMANMITSHLSLPRASLYFNHLKQRQVGDPLPAIPDWVPQRCAEKLQEALLALTKQKSPHEPGNWKTYATRWSIFIPDCALDPAVLTSESAPPTPSPANFPSLSESAAMTAAKSRAAAKKGSLSAPHTAPLKPQSSPTGHPSGATSGSSAAASSTTLPKESQPPIPPKASPPVSPPATGPSHSPMVIDSLPTPFLPPDTRSLSADVVVDPPDVPMAPLAAHPSPNISPDLTLQKERALRPLLHTASTITVRPPELPIPSTRPTIQQLYADAFALLPSLHTYYGHLTQRAKLLYDYLFNPTVLALPAKVEPSQPVVIPSEHELPDVPMLSVDESYPTTLPQLTPTSPAQDEPQDEPMQDAAAAPIALAPTPFSQLVADFVDLGSSFSDPRKLSAPQIQAREFSIDPLDPPGHDPITLSSYSPLLRFLHDQLSPYLSSIMDLQKPVNTFLTLIVGDPDHPNAPACLHSHMVGCHVSLLSDYRSFLFVPIGSTGVWNGPSDWAPLIVYLLVTSLFPDLPCLVCTPSHQLRSFASLSSLYAIFEPAEISSGCPCVYFSSSEYVVRGDIFLYLPSTAPLGSSSMLPDPFRIHSPETVLSTFTALREQHHSSTYTWRANLLDNKESIDADQHFPFYCTPYYGFSPRVPSRHVYYDFRVNILLMFLCLPR